MSRAKTRTLGSESDANPTIACVIEALSTVDMNLADEAIAYEYGMAIVDLRGGET